MALNTVPTGTTPSGRYLDQLIRELQGLTISILTGAGAATPIALAGIGTNDTILRAFKLVDPGAAATAAIVPLTPSIPSAGNVQFAEATNANAGDRVIVVWFDKGTL